MNIELACEKLREEHYLTGAENSILFLLAQGYSPREIADLRSRSIETVRTQIKAVKEKLCVYRTNKIPELVSCYANKHAV